MYVFIGLYSKFKMFLLVHFKEFILFITKAHTHKRVLLKQLPAAGPGSPPEIGAIPLRAVQLHIVMAFFTQALEIVAGVRQFFKTVQRFGEHFKNKKAPNAKAQQ